ncbi:MAG: hypothetical protein IJS15_11245 [Victivallales bacterium]|nr:hypothetical protein [Victivallales bacterium]
MKIRQLTIMAAILLVAVTDAWAQVGLKLKAERDKYLKYEPIQMSLLVRNYSGNTLLFGEVGDTQGRLLFDIVSRSGKPVRSLSPKANPIAGMVFAPGESKVLSITLNSLYDLQNDDYYTITAYVEHKRMAKGFKSNTINFEVRDGIIITKRTIGLPTEADNQLIKNVTASLIRFNEGNHSEIYCLRIEDESAVYGTFRLGPYIIGGQPQLDADGTSAIHVLVQVSSRLYSYAVYSLIKGRAVQRMQRYYIPDNGTPQISRSTGYLKILYARPAVEGVDYQVQK